MPNKTTQSATQTSRLGWDKRRNKELFRLYKEQGDQQAREELIMNYMNLVNFLANKFKGRGESLDDLVSVATIGLIKAIDRFDPDRGLEFTTYATPTIMGELKRHFRDKGWSVRVPRRLQELSSKINKATDELTTQLQHTPSTEELADFLGVTPEAILEAKESSGAYASESLDAPLQDQENALSTLDKYPLHDESLESSDDRMLITEAVKNFTPREQQVIKLRFVDGMTQTEIAQAMDISQVQVSRLLRTTLKKLQDKIDPDGLMKK